MLEILWKKFLRRRRITLWSLAVFPLWICSLFYRLGFNIQKLLSRSRVKLEVPVVSIGNISVGGTGKTTLVGFLADALFKEGLRVGLVSSGYGRVSEETIIEKGYKLVSRSVEETGDEMLFLASMLPDTLFAIGRSKAETARALSQKADVDIVLIDDGFQHFALDRDIDIVTYDAAVDVQVLKPFPYGVLRESQKSLKRADIIIITRSDFARNITRLKNRLSQYNKDAAMYHARFVAGELIGHDTRRQIKYLEDKSVFLFAGIGNFDSFRRQVHALVADIDGVCELSDHQVYDERLCRKLAATAERYGSDLILTTGKDFVKLAGFDFGREIYYLSQTIDLDPGEEKLVGYLKRKAEAGKQSV